MLCHSLSVTCSTASVCVCVCVCVGRRVGAGGTFCWAALLAAARGSEEGKHIFIPPYHGHGAAGNNRFQNTAMLGFC